MVEVTVWFEKLRPFRHRLIASTIIGLLAGASFNATLHLRFIDRLPDVCEDTIVVVAASNRCPSGMYLEFVDNGSTKEDDKRYIVCHCEPLAPQPIINVNPGSVEPERPPEARPPRFPGTVL